MKQFFLNAYTRIINQFNLCGTILGKQKYIIGFNRTAVGLELSGELVLIFDNNFKLT